MDFSPVRQAGGRSRSLLQSPDSSASRFASIDLGSHTTRLLVASCPDGRAIHPLHTDRRVTRLARGFRRRGRLEEDGVRSTLEALKEYARAIEGFGARSVACGATGVVRRAANRRDLLEAASREAGLEIRVISEDEEARLSAKGVLSVLEAGKGPLLIFDLGGSSTEFSLVLPEEERPVFACSVFLGAATLTEKCLPRAPAEREDLRKALEVARENLAPSLDRCRGSRGSPKDARLVGTAGTVTTLAAMYLEMPEYRPYRVNGLQLSENWLTRTVDRLAGASLEERRRWPGLEKGREDIVLGGALIVQAILESLDASSFVVTDAGLLEGLLMSGMEEAWGLPSSLRSPFSWKRS